MTDKTDSKEREAFEAWFSSDGKWPRSVERNGDCYKLIQAQQAWAAFQAGRASLAANAGSEPVALNPRHIRKFLQALQAGEMSVSRAVEILNAWVGGYYSDDMVPPPPADSCLIADDDFPMEIVRKLRAKIAANPSPPEGMVGGWTKASQQLPPCRDDQIYLGINTAGFAGMFNAVASIAGDVHCMYETPEETIDVMSGLDIWQPFTPPPTYAGSGKGE